MIIDVREPYELEICHVEGAQHIPMRQIPEQVDSLARDGGRFTGLEHELGQLADWTFFDLKASVPATGGKVQVYVLIHVANQLLGASRFNGSPYGINLFCLCTLGMKRGG